MCSEPMQVFFITLDFFVFLLPLLVQVLSNFGNQRKREFDIDFSFSYKLEEKAKKLLKKMLGRDPSAAEVAKKVKSLDKQAPAKAKAAKSTGSSHSDKLEEKAKAANWHTAPVTF